MTLFTSTSWRLAAVLLAAGTLAACAPDTEAPAGGGDTMLRAVRTLVAEPVEAVRVRSFPSVLEPPQITPLAFEVGGRLGPVTLQIGQRVTAGDLLVSIDTRDFDERLAQAEAALAESESAARRAAADADRQEDLFTKGFTAQAARDEARAAREQAEARVEQARRSLALTRKSREDTALVAPFDGVVNSIDVQNFANVQAGEPVLTLYQDTGLQASVLVGYEIVSQLELGQAVEIVPADRPESILSGRISEIAQRAPAVSAFPVIVALEDDAPWLRSGMAADVRVALPLAKERVGVRLPITALATHRMTELGRADSARARTGIVFVIEPENPTSVGVSGRPVGTVREREVRLGGVDTTDMLVTGGLRSGERVATAGVTFLRPEQRVTLWEPDASTSPATDVPAADTDSGDDS